MIPLIYEESKSYEEEEEEEEEACHMCEGKFCTDEHDENYKNRKKG